LGVGVVVIALEMSSITAPIFNNTSRQSRHDDPCLFDGDATPASRLAAQRLVDEFGDQVRDRMRKADAEATPLAKWTLHDLRRTARTLMSRAHVDPDIAERALGHVNGGVRGVYDRYEYREEKRQAFEALAREVRRIVGGEAAKVVPLGKKAARRRA
jgi:integrase